MEQHVSPLSKPVKVPGPEHPITIERNPTRVVVSVAGRVVADTRDALTLHEARYPPVHYIPRKDVDMTPLERTDHATYCPYKGDCAYFSIPAAGDRSVNAVWTYEEPYQAVASIKIILPSIPIESARSRSSRQLDGCVHGLRIPGRPSAMMGTCDYGNVA
jgi:uncharacterized protein (DUF427 family)